MIVMPVQYSLMWDSIWLDASVIKSLLIDKKETSAHSLNTFDYIDLSIDLIFYPACILKVH